MLKTHPVSLWRQLSYESQMGELLSNLVYGRPESGGDFLLLFRGVSRWSVHRYPVLKPYTLDDLRQALEPAQLAPAFLRRQCQLEYQAQQRIPGHAVLGPGGPMTDRGEARFDGVSRPNVNPVLGRKVVKGQQGRPVLDQLVHRLGILGAEVAHKAVERLSGLGFGFGHPDLMEARLGLALNGFWQFIEHMGRLVHPAALAAGVWPDLVQGRPETQGAVTDRQLRRRLQTACLQVLDDAAPGSLGLPVTVG